MYTEEVSHNEEVTEEALKEGVFLRVITPKKVEGRLRRSIRVSFRVFFVVVVALILVTSCDVSQPPVIVVPTQTVDYSQPVYQITISRIDLLASPRIIYARERNWSEDRSVLYYVDMTGQQTWYNRTVSETIEILQIIP